MRVYGDARPHKARGPWAGRDTLLYALAELLSPTRCVACERAGAVLCPRCLERIRAIDPAHACIRCGAPFGHLVCTECARDALHGEEMPKWPNRCACAGVFESPLPELIRSYKDGGEWRLARPIAELLYDTALHAETAAPLRYGGLISAADAVVFVPATQSAQLRRGFDHMELVAREFSALSGVPVLDALAKRGSADQRELGRAERQQRALGAYEVVQDVAGKRLLLVDDVYTTGATIRAAATALARKGAAHVDALVLARVW